MKRKYLDIVNIVGCISGTVSIISTFTLVWLSYSWINILKNVTFIILMICAIPTIREYIKSARDNK